MSRPALEDALSSLTPAQLKAANWDEGSLLVLAGPGSGKTRVLTTRIARILSEKSERAFRILALTFTNKAADEMTARVVALVPSQERRASVGTFHSFCMQMLQQHGSHIGIRPDFAIYSLDADRREMLREAIRRHPDLAWADDRYLAVIDKLKAALIGPDGCAHHFKDASAGARIEAVYKAYETALADTNALDFGSLIARAYELLTSFPAIAASYRRAYAYWMIDEFQDTTDGQYRLLKALAGSKFRNVFAVADDDQIIYQWNGASFRQIQRFRADFQPTLIQLPTNYRCPPAIVAAANRLVVHNAQRTTTKLPLEAGKTNLRYPDHEHIVVRRFVTDEAEAKGIAADITSLGPAIWGATAVLARTRALLEKAQLQLANVGVPAVIAQRRDEFRSPQFQWMNSALRQASRPLERRTLETLTGAFNRWFGTDLRADLVMSEAEESSRGFLEEWALSVPNELGSPNRQAAATLALKLARDPSCFKSFIEDAMALFPSDADAAGDIAEDLNAWRDLVRTIRQTIGPSGPLEQFLQELALRSKEPPIGNDTVTLMTIHGAKGKEFDHVYVIGLAEDILPSFQSVKAGEDSPEMEEERRNCFVAITRARECLRLSWAEQYRGWSKRPSRFLTEMGLELP